MKRGSDDASEAGPQKKARQESYMSRFLVSNQVAGTVIGKGGATVKGIRSEAGVVVSIKSDPAVTTDRVLAIMGKYEAIKHALSLVIKHLISVDEQCNEFQMLVQNSGTGAVIGKGGATIKQIMADSGASLRLGNEVLPGSTEKACKITGTPEQITAAYLLIARVLEDNPPKSTASDVLYLSGSKGGGGGGGGGAPGGYGAPPPPQHAQDPYAQYAAYYGYAAPPNPYAGYAPAPGAADPYSAYQPPPMPGYAGAPTQELTEVDIPAHMIGALIGKGGQMIQGINQRSGCTVSVEEATTADGSRKALIRGPWEGIEVALQLVRQVVEPEPVSELVDFTIPVPSHAAGLVIGKGGSVIKNIKNKTSVATLSLADATAENPNQRLLTVRGGPFAVACVNLMITHKMSSPEASQGTRAVAAGGSSQQTYVPSNCAGQVIGKGGSTIATIKQRSGCSISIAPVSAEMPDQRTCTVTGTPEGVQMALALIHEKVQLGLMHLGQLGAV